VDRITSVKNIEYQDFLEIASIQFTEYEIYVFEKYIFFFIFIQLVH